MPVLASDGGHKLSTTDRINTRVGSDYRGSHIPHLSGSPPIKNSRGLPPIVGLPLVKNNIHQAKLAKEYHHFPARKSKRASTDTTTLYYRQGVDTTICRMCQHARRSGRRRGRLILTRKLENLTSVRNRCSRGSITVYTPTGGERRGTG